ncbi:hypothetical protein IFM58399_03687 [Aspergillus lentulus]|uniref:DNA helicase ZGRF1-like domain-containing protein n=1 Tax=Aspergillus lentulus TaxID=293939 RepID=UPI0013951EA4|nr:uncharacterized protein IFM58399_03687 [Aspergillus lentulus]KAF4153069.1 hypothetical protein CNMCM6069_001213 [Aspergillus lentulus]KAF4163191.1 hypothetical protein CNMCM6936_001053 [Aspergillus lentulus]GFF33869.1 hypothetical protein IFM58399_03687 [Aspergillus lentulus]GFF68472.1 hypothetical protein IFM62136_07287 [Aspergillus lentulus]GFF74299.1 hypothetical protein IFM47457_03607 [Aspergillus lentulus]
MSIPLSSAATPRGTPSLNVPATQNTAPVIKFRCLFTHDVRRKAKRWHDGFLRYHTFNKRVMVYDTTGYFIGDLHWRQDDGIQDGDELELDKGVLIQVCEPVEQTRTDLSTLYNNKKKTQESPTQAADPSAPSFRTSAPLRSSISSQQRRSLNDVLGIRKTHAGLSVSPYEERQRQKQKEDNRLASERAAKRQKTTPAEVPTEQQPSRSVVNPPVLVDLSESPDENAPERPQKPNKIAETVSLPKKNPASNGPALPVMKGSVVDNVPREVGKHQNSSNNSPPSASRPSSAHSSSEAPTRTLRLPTSQPRKKLMYQALLPSQAPGKAARTVPSSSQDRKIVPTQSRPHESDPFPTPDPTSTNMEFIPTESTMFVLEAVADGPVRNPRQILHREPLGCPTAQNTIDATTSAAKMQTLQPTTSNNPGQLRVLGSSSIDQSARTQNMHPPNTTSKGLRKALSDPTAMTTSTSVQSRSLLSRDSVDTYPIEEQPPEQGPWTSEALDLFDFWPPGRPKPS